MAVRATTKGRLIGEKGPERCRFISYGFEASMEHRLKKYHKITFRQPLVNPSLVMTWVNVKTQVCDEEMSKGCYGAMGGGDEDRGSLRDELMGSWEEELWDRGRRR